MRPGPLRPPRHDCASPRAISRDAQAQNGPGATPRNRAEICLSPRKMPLIRVGGDVAEWSKAHPC